MTHVLTPPMMLEGFSENVASPHLRNATTPGRARLARDFHAHLLPEGLAHISKVTSTITNMFRSASERFDRVARESPLRNESPSHNRKETAADSITECDSPPTTRVLGRRRIVAPFCSLEASPMKTSLDTSDCVMPRSDDCVMEFSSESGSECFSPISRDSALSFSNN